MNGQNTETKRRSAVNGTSVSMPTQPDQGSRAILKEEEAEVI